MHDIILNILFIAYTRSAKPLIFVTFVQVMVVMDYLSKGDLRSYLLQLTDERYACVHHAGFACTFM